MRNLSMMTIKKSNLFMTPELVTPSLLGFPMTFLEACAKGTPIITIMLGDELGWIDNKVGYVTSPTPTNLADAMYRILLDKYLCDKFSENCKSIVKSKFSLDVVTDKLEHLYASFIS